MYVGLKQPRGDGERYVTPARAAAKETNFRSNTVATFLSTFRFVTGSSGEMFAAEIVNVSSVLFQEIPSVLTTGSCPAVFGNSVALT